MCADCVDASVDKMDVLQMRRGHVYAFCLLCVVFPWLAFLLLPRYRGWWIRNMYTRPCDPSCVDRVAIFLRGGRITLLKPHAILRRQHGVVFTWKQVKYVYNVREGYVMRPMYECGLVSGGNKRKDRDVVKQGNRDASLWQDETKRVANFVGQWGEGHEATNSAHAVPFVDHIAYVAGASCPLAIDATLDRRDGGHGERNGQRLAGGAASWQDVTLRRALFGANVIDILIPNPIMLFLWELWDPIYLFQMLSIVVWVLDHYAFYASCIASLVILSVGYSVYITSTDLHRLRKAARLDVPVVVLGRSNEPQVLQSSELVAGDVVCIMPEEAVRAYQSSAAREQGNDTRTSAAAVGGAVDSEWLVPCDCVLLSGSAILNEATLSGEAVPVKRVAAIGPECAGMSVDEMVAEATSADSEKSCVRWGTTVYQAFADGEGDVCRVSDCRRDVCLHRWPKAVVTRTGWGTAFGRLMRDVVHCEVDATAFSRESVWLVAIMALISGVCAIISLVWFLRYGVSVGESLLRALDLVTTGIPPSLPVVLSCGLVYAKHALRRRRITCSKPHTISSVASVDRVVFDKTGTLTSERMSLKRVMLEATMRQAWWNGRLACDTLEELTFRSESPTGGVLDESDVSSEFDASSGPSCASADEGASFFEWKDGHQTWSWEATERLSRNSEHTGDDKNYIARCVCACCHSLQPIVDTHTKSGPRGDWLDEAMFSAIGARFSHARAVSGETRVEGQWLASLPGMQSMSRMLYVSSNSALARRVSVHESTAVVLDTPLNDVGGSVTESLESSLVKDGVYERWWVVKTFDFDSCLRRMSVLIVPVPLQSVSLVVSDNQNGASGVDGSSCDNMAHGECREQSRTERFLVGMVLCKGSVETIADLCKQAPLARRGQCIQEAAGFERMGERVLGFCVKRVLIRLSDGVLYEPACGLQGASKAAGEPLWERTSQWSALGENATVMQASRHALERGSTFAGFIRFAARMKVDARKTVDVLHATGLETTMSTGDSFVAAMRYASSVHILPANALAFVPSDRAMYGTRRASVAAPGDAKGPQKVGTESVLVLRVSASNAKTCHEWPRWVLEYGSASPGPQSRGVEHFNDSGDLGQGQSLAISDAECVSAMIWRWMRAHVPTVERALGDTDTGAEGKRQIALDVDSIILFLFFPIQDATPRTSPGRLDFMSTSDVANKASLLNVRMSFSSFQVELVRGADVVASEQIKRDELSVLVGSLVVGDLASNVDQSGSTLRPPVVGMEGKHLVSVLQMAACCGERLVELHQDGGEPYQSGTVTPYSVDADALHELLVYRILRFARVFARMSPVEKEMLVSLLEGRAGHTVLMVGDGANDCGALNSASAGLALTESSTGAIAPFSTRLSVSSACILLSECRCAFATSLAALQFMVAYSLIEMATVFILYTMNTNLSDGQYVFIELFMILGLAVTMSSTEATPLGGLHSRTDKAKKEEALMIDLEGCERDYSSLDADFDTTAQRIPSGLVGGSLSTMSLSSSAPEVQPLLPSESLNTSSDTAMDVLCDAEGDESERLAKLYGATYEKVVLEQKRVAWVPISLFSSGALGEVVLSAFVCVATQVAVICWLRITDPSWYDRPSISAHTISNENDDNTVLFYVSCFQYIIVAITYASGSPFTAGILKNRGFVAVALVAMSIMVVSLVNPESSFIRYFSVLQVLPITIRVGILFIIVPANFLLCFLATRFCRAKLVCAARWRKLGRIWRV